MRILICDLVIMLLTKIYPNKDSCCCDGHKLNLLRHVADASLEMDPPFVKSDADTKHKLWYQI